MTTSSFDWNELSKYAASKKLDYLVEDDNLYDIHQVTGFDGYTDEEILEMTKEETMWMCLCILYTIAKERGVKTFMLTELQQDAIDEIPYCINEMPNGDKYITFDNYE